MNLPVQAFVFYTSLFHCFVKSGISFDLDLPVKYVEEPILVSENISSPSDLLFHHLHLSQAVKSAVIVTVYPVENETLDVYIQFNELPTTTRFYRKVQVRCHRKITRVN